MLSSKTQLKFFADQDEGVNLLPISRAVSRVYLVILEIDFRMKSAEKKDSKIITN